MTPDLLAIERALYRKSYYDFFVAAYAQLHPGEAMSDNWHIQYLCDRLQAEAERIVRGEPRSCDLIVNCPFRAAKSLIFSVCFNAWVWTWHPQFKLICVSFSADLALELALKTRQLLQSAWYRERFPEVQLAPDNNQKGFYETTAGGFRKSVGTGGQITGSGGHLILVDDVQDPQRADSATERKRAISFYTGTLYSRVNNLAVGSRVIVQQRLHEQDLSGYLLAENPDAHEHICIPGELNDTVSPPALASYYVNGQFWPDRFTPTVLADFAKTLGPRQYANQVLQKPAPDEGLVFKKEWFRTLEARPPGTVDFYLDTASTDEAKNDASAILGVIRRGEEVVVTYAERVRKTMPELLGWVADVVRRHGSPASRLYIENKSSGIALLQLLRARTRLHITPLEPGKLSKEERAHKATPTVADGRVALLQGVWNQEFLDEVTTYPAGKHDDYVDCLAYAINSTGGTGWKAYT